MKIGVRVHDLGKDYPNALAKKAKEIGFDGVQLVINKALMDETGLAGSLNKTKACAIRRDFNDNGIEIFMLGAYFNPVHSNYELVEKNILKFKEHLKYANDFNTLYVGSETGSYNDDKWTYNPKNRTKEALNRVSAIFGMLANYARDYNSYVAIEGAYGHVCYNPDVLKDLYDSIDNGHVRIIVDIYNYLYIGNYMEHTKILDKCIKLFKDKIVIFHIKDFMVENGILKQVPIGKGLMNFNYMIKKMKIECPNAYLIFEGSKPEDMKDSLIYIKKLLEE